MNRTIPMRRPLAFQASSSPPPFSPMNDPVDVPSDNEARQSKRRRTSNDAFPTSSTDASDSEDIEPVESIDLTEVDGSTSLAKALAKQREDAVKAQQGAEEEKGRSIVTAFKCPVCMDTPVDATTTVCGMQIRPPRFCEKGLTYLGHLFCHKCIVDTLRFGEDQRADSSSKPRGTCPVCRKPLTRTDTFGPKRNLVPIQLQLKKRNRNPPPVESG